jgi:DNA-binding HxlR family transcriptional regulator
MTKQKLIYNVFHSDCPARRVIESVSGKWTLLTIFALKDGSIRFNQLRRLLENVSQKMLTQTLRDLENDGFVDRLVIPTVPITVSYSLTPLGRDLLSVVDGVRTWANKNAPAMERARLKRVARANNSV